ncbi:MAG: ribosome recycling factor [Nitrospirota bacterium]|nr:ribosome recycling factor [Nitrospirota bacterium]
MEKTINKSRASMDAAIDHLKKDLARIRTGRASVSLLDSLLVDYYGTPTPVAQVSNVSVPEPRLLTIQPWEQKMLEVIERAIFASDLGVTPTNDGKIIRLPMPPLTEERRKEFVKQAHKMAEETRVSIRNARRDAIDEIKKLQKDGDVSEDDSKRGQDRVQKLTDDYNVKVDEIVKRKDHEIMEV